MWKALILATFVVAIFSVATKHVNGQPPTEPTYSLAICETEFGNYTTQEYDTNLKTVLSTLLKQANSSSVFHSTSAGTGSDTVFGQYYCRGDIPSSLCDQCFRLAAGAALLLCPQAKAAAVFFQECTLHYQNQALLGVESERPGIFVFSKSNVTDPASFFTAANSTITDLVHQVAASETGKFATGEGVVSGNETVHCLVQCSPDMNATQCLSCLDFAAQVTLTCCGEWPSYLYVFLPSCQMMYNSLGTFYYTPNAPPSPPTVSSSAPPAALNSVRITRIP